VPRKKSEKKPKVKTIGRLPPQYKFILNQYSDTRLSSCPICQRLTHMRKFALLILIEKAGLLTLGKTCRYCTLCELIIAHKDELEDELVYTFENRAMPEVIGNPYYVIGTVDKKHWKASLEAGGMKMDELLDNAADFRDVLNFHFTPGGWAPTAIVGPAKPRARKK
jgi:hypothetical protein